MRILLTGATGYIGKRLLPSLVDEGHRVVCCVRDLNRFTVPKPLRDYVSVVEVDFLEQDTLSHIPEDIDAAYYLIHSMSSSRDFAEMEAQAAQNFCQAMPGTRVKQVIYLSGIVNQDTLSKHLDSRKRVEDILSMGDFHLTTLRAGIIIGSGSASFEIIRDLVEKLPVMVAPRWLQTKCQPIGIRDVLAFLTRSLLDERTYDRSFDIGGKDILSYKEMLYGYAKVRGLRRKIFIVPVMTPRLSSYWLYFVTSTSYKLAVSLVDSMKVEVICKENELAEWLDVHPAGYLTSLERTLTAIDTEKVVSSWKDSLVSGRLKTRLSEFMEVPKHGCFVYQKSAEVKDRQACIQRIWSIGGSTGWYYADWLWKLRGRLDKLFAGVGLRRGRTDARRINPGDTVDFWRVLIADKERGRLLLFAEMRTPGEAWLEFRIEGGRLYQTATFRPKGVAGRLYWYSTYPFHLPLFTGMVKKLAG